MYLLNRKCIEILAEFVNKASKVSSKPELDCLKKEYTEKLSNRETIPEFNILSEEIFSLCSSLVSERQNRAGSDQLTELSLEEHLELEQVDRIIDDNLLLYHFQPIVSASDGSIFSYEALMRPVGIPLLSPYHILKYAALTGRLREIEKATFMNVLTMVDEKRDIFNNRPVFINSIPNILLDGDDLEKVDMLLARNADNVVVEMTEQAVPDEKMLQMIKERYSSLNIRIAIDDYGTGYSNIKNLLDYMPNFVKIDRSLLSNIHNSSKKRHFVRDIVEFCHDNGIRALAEGVENSEELRAVILLNVDLIQGFYTAKPSPVPIDVIDEDVRQEILRCRSELIYGTSSKQYVAAADERIPLDMLVRDGFSSVLVGRDLSEGARVTVTGSLITDSAIKIQIDRGFKGTLVLEQVKICSVDRADCIELGADSELNLELSGENYLFGRGIFVPETAALTMTGEGSLRIELNESDYYGIGADTLSKHGKLTFSHNSMLEITANGESGVAIGSGKGGDIVINSGKYFLSLIGKHAVGFGSLEGYTKIDIFNCDLETRISGAMAVSLGSLNGSCEVTLIRSSYRCRMSGPKSVGIGCCGTGTAGVAIDYANVDLDINGSAFCDLGSFEGDSEILVSRASLVINGEGSQTLSFGSCDGNSSVKLVHADVEINISSVYNVYTFCDNLIFDGGRLLAKVNGKAVELN